MPSSARQYESRDFAHGAFRSVGLELAAETQFLKA